MKYQKDKIEEYRKMNGTIDFKQDTTSNHALNDLQSQAKIDENRKKDLRSNSNEKKNTLSQANITKRSVQNIDQLISYRNNKLKAEQMLQMGPKTKLVKLSKLKAVKRQSNIPYQSSQQAAVMPEPDQSRIKFALDSDKDHNEEPG